MYLELVSHGVAVTMSTRVFVAMVWDSQIRLASYLYQSAHSYHRMGSSHESQWTNENGNEGIFLLEELTICCCLDFLAQTDSFHLVVMSASVHALRITRVGAVYGNLRENLVR